MRNHPIIPNANQYFFEKRYVSISSDDRDLIRYPESSQFEIELPQDYLNVASIRLYSWSFPSNYNVFSALNYNIVMTFKLVNLYNPGAVPVSNPLTEGIFAALYAHLDTEYLISIETGFYNPDQMAIELTNKMNAAVTDYVYDFFQTHADEYPEAKALFTGYDRFHVVYHAVGQNLWFGNNADQFVLTNDSVSLFKSAQVDTSCARRNMLPSFARWGLPSYLGFTRCAITALTAAETPNKASIDIVANVPRFYYGSVSNTSDNGYWLIPVLPGATVYFLKAPEKISFMGPAYVYMEIEGQNCIDETIPYNLSEFTTQTNITNGVVNSSFAKIPIPTTPISQWFDSEMAPYKYYNPPAERIRRLKIRFRYHNGQMVDFGQFEYSFMLEFNLLKPQQERSYSIREAYGLGQIQQQSGL